MYNNRSRGFTLIELLVVIAIIGILSAVVLASLNTARSKGNDAAIQSDLSTIQTEAEIYYGGTGNNSYGPAATSCTAAGSMFVVDTTIAKAITGADSANGAGTMVCNASATAYAVSSTLSTDPTRSWCVDSTGGSSKSTTALGTNTVCPPSN
ncbi:MAG: type II secretion system protein [Patescibacteria group bacterium]|nr:type II secretion system protein [Patescibacteria group bacterium]